LKQFGPDVTIPDKPTHKGSATRLSPRQDECLRGVLELKSAKQIARELGISPHAVEKHLKVARGKFGVATSAEAARMFAFQHKGSESPQSGFSDLVLPSREGHQRLVLEPAGRRPSLARFEDSHGAPSLDQPFSPRQTLLTIFALSLGSIVGLLLLVACAEGIKSLVSG
jgi:DNA-binding CsgD family transcriptional regulator